MASGSTDANVELIAHLRRRLESNTVMLKGLTRFGARIEGLGTLENDEAVSLSLPGCRPALAFVAWSNPHCAGVEFAEPLDAHVYADLVTNFAIKAP